MKKIIFSVLLIATLLVANVAVAHAAGRKPTGNGGCCDPLSDTNQCKETTLPLCY